jgi:hypothetical protein
MIQNFDWRFQTPDDGKRGDMEVAIINEKGIQKNEFQKVI